jgi:cytochrome P450
MAVHIDMASWEPRYTEDPYPFFAQLREQAPVTPVVLGGMAAWLVTRYDDILAGLSDPRLSNDPAFADPATRAVPWFRAVLTAAEHMGRKDPPDHTRLRGLVAKAFTPRRIEALRPWLQQVAGELVAAIQPRGRADVVAELAQPLPLTVISELFGVPTAERQDFGAWTHVLFGVDEGDAARVAEAHTWISTYLTRLIERRNSDHAGSLADPEAGTLLDGLIAARHEGERINDRELLSMVFLLLVAGYETTVNLIASGVLSLLRNPDQYAALRADPALIRSAIEELLRHESPVKITPFMRFTTTEVTLGGAVIPAHQPVLFAFGAGNRDPAQFPDPDRLDLTRSERTHMAFGHGIHFCLGAPLARLEAEIAFTTLLAGCPDLALAVEPGALEWRHSQFMRGLKRLPVTFTARAPASRP